MATRGKLVGRLRVNVFPDGTKFREQLKLMLKRAEQSMSLNLAVTADTDAANAQLRRLKKDWDGQKVDFKATVSSAVASTRIAAITRPRHVELTLKVSKASAAKVATLLATFSGARLAGDLIENLGTKLQNLDRALPKIAAVSTSIGTLSSVLITGVGGIFTLVSGLVQMLGVLAALPGILGGAAVGATVLGLALVDVPKQLGSLKPAFEALQNTVSANFWAKARKPIISFVKSTLPELRKGLDATATGVGNWAATVVGSFQTAFGGGRITAMFQPLLQSIDIAATGATGFAQALAVLGQVGGSYLPRLAQWVADLSNQFGAYLLQIESSGRLTEIIDAGITAAKLFGSSLSSLASIWSAISDAATAAGGGGLASFAATLAAIAAIVNAPEFQSAMTQIFAGAAAGASGLATAFAPIGAMFSALAPVIANILATTGAVFGTVLGQIATALSSPAFSTGLTEFFAGILGGIQAVAPALPALADAFGTFLSFAGALGAELGPVIGALLTALAPALTDVLNAVKPLLPILGDGLVGIIKMLAPILSTIISTLLPPIVSLVSSLVPLLMPIVQAILPVISALLPPLVSIIEVLGTILAPILALLAPIVDLLGTQLANALSYLTPLIEVVGTVLSVVAGIISGVLGTAIELIIGVISGDLSGALQRIGTLWSGIWDGISAKFQEIWTGIQSFAKTAFNVVSGLIGGFVNGAIDILNGLTAGINDLLAALNVATGGTINLKIGKIPHILIPSLAVGADIRATPGGVITRLGEGGRDERVIDKGLGNRALALSNALAQRALAGSGARSGDTYWELNEVTDAAGTAMAIIRRQEAREA